MKQHSHIALVGAPNAGKSTLTNSLLGQKLTIVSPKAQTTRNSIKAIVIEGDKQLILIDTPGIFLPNEERILERIIVKSAWQALRDADHVCFLIDVNDGMNRKNSLILEDLKRDNIKPTIIINKIDSLKKHNLLEITAKLAELGFVDIFMISAKNGEGVGDLRKFLLNKCTNPGWIYEDAEQITDAPMRFIASEITREKLFLKLNQELPYSLTVKTDSYEVLNNGQIKIHQTIFVLKENQKSIILGKNGSMIKAIGEEARRDLAEIAGAKVHLFLFVKTKPDWMNDSESYEMMDIEKLPRSA